jgi:hypothetical protein
METIFQNKPKEIPEDSIALLFLERSLEEIAVNRLIPDTR